jgi:hypothetical protein
LKPILVLILGIFLVGVSPALLAENGSQGEASVVFTGGLWLASGNNVELTHGGIVRSEISTAFFGSAGVGYYISEDFMVGVSAGIIAAKVSVHQDTPHRSERSEVVIPVLFGVRYYSHFHSFDSTLHPYLSLSLGPFIGLVSRDDVETEVVRSEPAFGGKIGAGIEKRIGENFVLSLNGALYLVSNYAGAIAGRRNFNGSELSIGFGILLGGGATEEIGESEPD